jgi:hypothetical protein
MIDLANTALRVQRDGRWRSLFIAELDHITPAEIDGLRWADELRDTLAADPTWRLEGDRWVRSKGTNSAARY